MNIEDVKKLAMLARVDMGEEEMAGIAKDFDSILAYVGQVQQAVKTDVVEDKKPEDYRLHNIMREDVVTNNRGEYTDKILEEMPDTEAGFLKVKQIL